MPAEKLRADLDDREKLRKQSADAAKRKVCPIRSPQDDPPDAICRASFALSNSGKVKRTGTVTFLGLDHLGAFCRRRRSAKT